MNTWAPGPPPALPGTEPEFLTLSNTQQDSQGRKHCHLRKAGEQSAWLPPGQVLSSLEGTHWDVFLTSGSEWSVIVFIKLLHTHRPQGVHMLVVLMLFLYISVFYFINNYA